MKRILSLIFLICFVLSGAVIAANYGYEFYDGIFLPGPVETYLKLRDDGKDRRGLGIGLGENTTTYAGTTRTQHNWITGELETIGANILRFDVDGALFEGASENILLQSRTFTAAAGWTPTGVTTAKNKTGVDGVANSATTVTDFDTDIFADTVFRSISKSASDSTTYFTASIFIKKTTGATTFPALGLIFTGGTSKYAYFCLETDGGTATAVSFNTAANIGFTIESAGSFWRLSVWGTDNGTNTSIVFDFYPAFNADASNTEDTSVTGSAIIDAAQLELSAYPTSYIDSPNQLATMVDMSGGSETDGPGKVEAYPTLITLTDGDRDEDYYVTFDQGAGAITDFTHQVDVNVTSLIADGNSAMYPWAISNADDDINDIDGAFGDCVFINMVRVTADTHYAITIINIDGGTIGAPDISGAIAVGTPSYLTINRTGTTLTVEIYSTAALRQNGGAGDVETIAGTVVNTAFRYVYGIASYNSGHIGKDISGYVANLTLHAGNVQRVLDGGMDITAEAEEGVGVTVIGNCYKILEQTDIDYAATDGAPNNNVGTYWNSTVGGAVIDGGGGDDRLNRCTFKYWTEGTGWAPEASAGSLTNKAVKVAGAASNLTQNILTSGITYQIKAVETRTAGEVRLSAESSHGTYYGVNGTVYEYLTSNGNTLTIRGNTLYVGTIDDVTAMEHGTARLTEAGTTVWAISDDLHAVLQDEGAVVLTFTPGFNETDATIDGGILSVLDQVNSLVYYDVSDHGFASYDGTTEAKVAKAFVLGTEYKIAVRWPSSTGKYEIGVKDAGAWSWGAEVNFDGSFNPGASMIVGHSIRTAFHIKDVIFYRRPLTQALIGQRH